MKKILALILSLTLLLSMNAALFSVSAEETKVFRATETKTACTWIQENADNKYVEQQYDNHGSDPNNEGKFARLDATDKGCTITFTLTLEKAGIYDMIVRFRAHESTGNASLSVNGAKIGDFIGRSGGTTGHSANGCYDAEYTKVALVEGSNTVTFTTTEKGVSGYGVNIFKFTLTKIDTTVMTGSETLNSQTFYTAGKTGYSEFSGEMVPDNEHPDGSWAANYTYNDMYCFRVTDGSYFGYTIHVNKAGTYDLQWIARGHSGSYGTFGVYVNGREDQNLVKSGVSTYHTGGTQMLTFDLGSVELNQGDNTVYFVSEADDTIENNVFVSGAIVISDGSKVIKPDYTTAGYLSTRVNAKDSTKTDLRIVLVSDLTVFEEYATVSVTIEFYLDGNSVKTIVGDIGDDTKGFSVYSSVMAAGERYVTESPYAIYGIIVTEIPKDAWDSMTITVSSEETVFSQGSVTADSLS